ncbi:hypothetical protein OXX79_008910, partial [Metschnikowia pulcherrima]
MFRSIVAFAAFLSVTLAALRGCDPSTISNQGFTVNFYKYPRLGTAFKTESDYYTTGYKQYGFLKTVTGVTALNYATNSASDKAYYGLLYGYNLTVSNFTMSIGGYFLAQQTGDYVFTMYADDGGYLQFGAGTSCCGDALDDVSGDSFKAQWPNTATATFNLQKGVYYPIKIVFVNWSGPGGLNLKYVAPDGTTTTEVGSQVYQVQQVCTRTTTRTWTGSQTTTITTGNSFYESVIVEVPTPTSTVTTYWTGSGTTSTTISGSSGQSNTVIVELPQATTTSYWTNTYTSTTTVTPSSGGQPTVIVEVP